MQHVGVATMGLAARQRLGEARTATLLGVTRRGWLVRLDVGWVVFLSTEAQRGPLALNLAAGAVLPQAAPGLAGEVSGASLTFPQAGLRFDFGQAAVWSAPPLPGPALPAAERHACLVEVAQRCLAAKPASPLGAFLPILLGCERADPKMEPALLEGLGRLKSSLRGRGQDETPAGLAAGLAEALQPLLGWGRGLTPSGDDLALGLLLALSRWGAHLGWRVDGAALGKALAALTAQRTTTLAANLIACASLGQADERLLLALDGIVSGAPGPVQCAVALGDWGATSGTDALTGMALFLHQTK